ncbi:MAG: VOC family protein [Rhodospirillales bacterium]|nr:VOC family protein [Rhodospirillales bacterium]
MDVAGKATIGRFCWVDLAASSAGRAQDFYEGMFGWTATPQPANGGSFTRLTLADRDVASLYQLRRRQVEGGVPSHWTPYVCVANADAAVWRALSLGGTAVVRPFVVEGIARIALVLDAVGAPIGLWEPLPEAAHG